MLKTEKIWLFFFVEQKFLNYCSGKKPKIVYKKLKIQQTVGFTQLKWDYKKKQKKHGNYFFV